MGSCATVKRDQSTQTIFMATIQNTSKLIEYMLYIDLDKDLIDKQESSRPRKKMGSTMNIGSYEVL